jgi:hydrogenase/urease accessory protein HupE
MNRKSILSLTALTLMLIATTASAHPGHTESTGRGLFHYLTGWNHLPLLVASGLWCTRLHRRGRRPSGSSSSPQRSSAAPATRS